MLILIDDADLTKIEELYAIYPYDGVTTNPTILGKTCLLYTSDIFCLNGSVVGFNFIRIIVLFNVRDLGVQLKFNTI